MASRTSLNRKEKSTKDQTEMPGVYGKRSLARRNSKNETDVPSLKTGECLSLDQLKRISQHQGRHVGQSMMEPLLQPLWKKISEWIPVWCSPNAIIFIGLIFHGFTFFILLYNCSDAQSEASKWVYYLCAFGLATFFVLDAIDERQAQKTKCHAALRELFQHACHALSNMFLVLGACIATKLGSHPKFMFIELFSMLFIFYTVHWQAYCSGIINFHYLDSMEIQLIVIMLYIVTGSFGPGMWDVEILGYPLKFLPAITSLMIGCLCCLVRLSNILVQGGVGKNGSTIAGTSILSPLVPAFILFFVGHLVASQSQTFILQRHPILFSFFVGVPLTRLSCKIVVSHMTRGEMALLDDILYVPGIALLLQKLDLFEDYWSLWICLMFCLYYLLTYCFHVCNDVCNYLKITCFKVSLASDDNVQAYQQNASVHT